MDLSLVPVIIFALFFFVTPNTTSNIEGKTPDSYSAQKRYRNSNDSSFKSSASQKKDQISDAVKSARENIKVTIDDLFDEKKEKESILNYITSVFKTINKEDAEEISSGLVEYGKKYNLDPKLAAAVIARESGFNKKAVSRTGAAGLGQIKDFNFKSLKINNPFNIKENVSGTTEYLNFMLSKWKGKNKNVNMALASYYKGFTNVKKKGVDPKTEHYVNDILDYYDTIKKYRSDLDFKNQ
ncbi:transglycosylase SLT domain-containing protein [bacterium]|jgi:soluble lytic murein transglycosylase-like protein|nr:transglycosylase SLT domain-containing protein [bacterium]